MRSKLNEFLNESLSRGMLAMVTLLPTASTGAYVMGGLVWGGVVWEASVSSSCAASENRQKEILWVDNLDTAIRRSEQTGKPLMIHFYGDNCPPCRMLEKKAFRDESLIQTMNSSVIAVRINAERELKTALRFRVNRWPTDVYFYPNGEEIYRNVSNQDPAVFEKIIAKVADKNSQRREASSTNATLASYPKTSVTATVPNDTLAALTPATQIPATQGPARIRLTESTFNSVDTAEVAQSTPPSLPKDVTSAQSQSSPVIAEATQPLLASKATDESQAVSAAANVPSNLPEATAMGGHCPVTLRAAIDASKAGRTPSAAWVLGSPEHTARHRGRTYYFSSAETRDVFLKDPDRYAPVLSGCDLVEYSKSGKWIDGDCRYGFIEQESGRIFLFSSSSNCQEFARNCEAYSSMGSKRTGVE
jgi:YHS domain-containing protein/thioredoxin-like negative regulator of GroEL